MWTCPKCDRVFRTSNQSHICTKKDVGELFIDRPDELVLAWDTITQIVMDWQPNVYSASTKSVVYTNKKAWLIIKPMKDSLDVKFYHRDKLESDLIKKYSSYPNKFAHHIRIKGESEISQELISLLKSGFDYAME